jgi:hypothetical protein
MRLVGRECFQMFVAKNQLIWSSEDEEKQVWNFKYESKTKRVELHELSDERNVRMGAPTRGSHMSETDAARSCLPIGPTVSLGRICSWNQTNAARMTTNLDGAVDSTTDSTTSPSCVDGTLVI